MTKYGRLFAALIFVVSLHRAVAQLGFASATNYNVGTYGLAVVAADVTGDGYVDLICDVDAVSLHLQNSLLVLTNDGNGIYSSNAIYTVRGGYSSSVVAADVNGDGYVDLICVEAGSRSLAVLMNNGGNGFAAPVTYAVGNQPFSVVAADLNGDSKMDLVCANQNDNTLSVLTNNGSGIFGSNATYNVGNIPTSVAAADVTGNGSVDLICANQGDDKLEVLTNDGSGTFGSNATYTAGIAPFSVIAADINGDGKPDLISANQGGTLSVLTNNGSGGFGSNATYNVGGDLVSVVAADVNGDGYLDLICANQNTNTLTVLTNDGTGGFTPATLPTIGYGPISITAADVNGDGKLDLISANKGASPGFNGTLSVLINTSSFPPPNSTPSLNINLLSNGVLVSWPSDSAGWSLQQNIGMTKPNWSPSGYNGYAITDDGTNKSLIITPPKGNAFFRLLHP
jgi:FG-GAP-like repeat